MNYNSTTIESYNNNLNSYIINTPDKLFGDHKIWLDQFLNYAHKNQFIFEIGSGSCRDSNYMKSKGYKVITSDASIGFIEKFNLDKNFDLLNDEFENSYSAIFANGVLLHISKKDIENVLKKIFDAMKQGGVFGFSLKSGKGEEVSTHKLDAPRFFSYWQKNEITKVLKSLGFVNIQISGNETWLTILAFKSKQYS